MLDIPLFTMRCTFSAMRIYRNSEEGKDVAGILIVCLMHTFYFCGYLEGRGQQTMHTNSTYIHANTHVFTVLFLCSSNTCIGISKVYVSEVNYNPEQCLSLCSNTNWFDMFCYRHVCFGICFYQQNARKTITNSYTYVIQHSSKNKTWHLINQTSGHALCWQIYDSEVAYIFFKLRMFSFKCNSLM